VLVRSGGRVIVVAAELAAIGAGIAGVVKGVRRSFAEEIDLSSTSPTARATTPRLGQVSYLAQGLALSLVGTQSAPCSAMRR
jgi:hypothetical protein